MGEIYLNDNVRLIPEQRECHGADPVLKGIEVVGCRDEFVGESFSAVKPNFTSIHPPLFNSKESELLKRLSQEIENIVVRLGDLTSQDIDPKRARKTIAEVILVSRGLRQDFEVEKAIKEAKKSVGDEGFFASLYDLFVPSARAEFVSLAILAVAAMILLTGCGECWESFPAEECQESDIPVRFFGVHEHQEKIKADIKQLLSVLDPCLIEGISRFDIYPVGLWVNDEDAAGYYNSGDHSIAIGWCVSGEVDPKVLYHEIGHHVSHTTHQEDVFCEELETVRDILRERGRDHHTDSEQNEEAFASWFADYVNDGAGMRFSVTVNDELKKVYDSLKTLFFNGKEFDRNLDNLAMAQGLIGRIKNDSVRVSLDVSIEAIQFALQFIEEQSDHDELAAQVEEAINEIKDLLNWMIEGGTNLQNNTPQERHEAVSLIIEHFKDDSAFDRFVPYALNAQAELKCELGFIDEGIELKEQILDEYSDRFDDSFYQDSGGGFFERVVLSLIEHLAESDPERAIEYTYFYESSFGPDVSISINRAQLYLFIAQDAREVGEDDAYYLLQAVEEYLFVLEMSDCEEEDMSMCGEAMLGLSQTYIHLGRDNEALMLLNEILEMPGLCADIYNTVHQILCVQYDITQHCEE